MKKKHKTKSLLMKNSHLDHNVLVVEWMDASNRTSYDYEPLMELVIVRAPPHTVAPKRMVNTMCGFNKLSIRDYCIS